VASETYAPNPINCVLGKGAIYFDRFTTAGVKGGLFHLGNANDLKAEASQSRVTLNNYVTHDGGVYAEGMVSNEITVSMTLYEFNRKNIALLTGGVENSATQATQTVSGETLSVSSALGAVYQTAYRSIATPSAILNGTSTLTTADWSVIDATAGLIKILSTASLTEGQTLTASYTASAIAATANKFVDLHSAGTIYGKLLYVSDNSAGAAGELVYWYTSVQQGGLSGLIGDEFGSSTLSFKVLNDAAGTYSGLSASAAALSPYGRWYRR
jgi:hypothetical protein